MTKATNPLRVTLESVLGPVGFIRKGDFWFRSTDEVVEVSNLQKSQYGEQYYLNYALWLRPLGEESFPKEEKCHIRMRAGAIVSSSTELGTLLDLESNVAEVERRSRLADVLTRELLPFAASCRTIEGLRTVFAREGFKQAMVHARAEAILSC